MTNGKQRDDKADEALNKSLEDSRVSTGAGGGTAGVGGGRSDQGRTGIGAAGASAMDSMGEVGGSAVGATRNVMRGAIGGVEDVGTGVVGGVAHIATDLVHGVTDLGYEVRNGATGLIGAVGDIGSAAVTTVAHLLVDVVGGVRQVVGAAIGDHHETTERGRDAAGARDELGGRERGEFRAPQHGAGPGGPGRDAGVHH